MNIDETIQKLIDMKLHTLAKALRETLDLPPDRQLSFEDRVSLLVDQEFGLLPYAPIYLMAIAGAVALARSRRDVLRAIAFVAAVYVGMIACPITNVHGWTGGWNPAGRFLTPVLPLAGMVVVFGLRSLPRLLVVAAIALQIVIDAYVWQHPKILWNDGDGRAAFFDAR